MATVIHNAAHMEHRTSVLRWNSSTNLPFEKITHDLPCIEHQSASKICCTLSGDVTKCYLCMSAFVCIFVRLYVCRKKKTLQAILT